MTWEISDFWGIQQQMTDGDAFAFWVRVPAGKADTIAGPVDFIVPTDYTLTRSRVLISGGMSNGGAAVRSAHEIAFGLIRWEGVSDDILDLGTVPHPFYDGSEDWIFRSVFPEVTSNHLFLNSPAGLDAYQSRAQRKLSNGSGILAIVGVAEAALGVPVTWNVDWYLEVRFLLREP